MNRNIYGKPQLYTNKDELLELINIDEQIEPLDYEVLKDVINNTPIPQLYEDCTYGITRANKGYQLSILQAKFDNRYDCWVCTHICTLCTLYYSLLRR